MFCLRILVLYGGIHRLIAVAVAAFARIRSPHARPFPFCQFRASGFKFFSGIDGPCQLSPQFGTCLEFARHFVDPVFGYMAVRTAGAHTKAVGIVQGLLVFLIYVAPYFMTGNTELRGIGRLYAGVETATDNYSGDEAEGHQRQQ